MTKFRERVTSWWPFLLLTAGGIPLLTPLLSWTAVTCTHDGHLHYHRVAAMRYAWENGLFFTRWLPDLAFGYGYPFFVYREPLPLYAVLWPHLLGLSLPAATNLFYAVTILACGWFMFLWVRDILGSWAGLVAGMAYMAAPYVLVDALVRGNSPESAALPLLPLLLWAGRRWLLEGRARWFGTAVLGLILLALSHNISMLIFVPTLGVYLLALAWLHRLNWRVWLVRLGAALCPRSGHDDFLHGWGAAGAEQRDAGAVYHHAQQRFSLQLHHPRRNSGSRCPGRSVAAEPAAAV
jgi:hypothetical protein